MKERRPSGDKSLRIVFGAAILIAFGLLLTTKSASQNIESPKITPVVTPTKEIQATPTAVIINSRP